MILKILEFFGIIIFVGLGVFVVIILGIGMYKSIQNQIRK